MSARKKKKNLKEKLKESLRRRSKRGQASPGPQEGGVILIPTPPGEVKMSEVLWAFVDPYLRSTRDEQGIRKLLDLALIAWCIPLFPPEHREGVVRDTLKAVPADVRPALAAMLAQMIQRKEAVFGDNTRMILSYDLTFTPTGPHLSVASTLAVN